MEVLLLSNEWEDMLVRLPQNICMEVRELIEQEDLHMDDFIYQAVVNYVQYKREAGDLHEEMRRGYEEMARINLHLCSEAFLAEEEAKTTSDRAVIGV